MPAFASKVREIRQHRPPTSAGFVPTRLAVSRPGDVWEQEADRVADEVTRTSPRPHSTGAAMAAPLFAPAEIHELPAAGGHALDPATRGFMEPRFGRDFSHVRVHADASAAGSAESLGARAYTLGHDIVFGAGEYRPATPSGRRLLAHELAHVVQQDASPSLRGAIVQRDGKKPDPPREPKHPAEDPKVKALKADLVSSFGLSAVTDPGEVKWTGPQLEKMKSALARIPTAERDAVRGVELTRVASTSEFGATASGLFTQAIDARTGVRRDRIEIANDAFSDDPDYDEGGAHTLFGGEVVRGAPSESVLAHEVGHAVESLVRRQAEAARIKSGRDTDPSDAERTTVKVSSGKRIPMTRRLAEFVALVEANRIDIKTSDLGNHVTSHWPDNPEEAYAELYAFSLTAPTGLRKFDKKAVMATYFTSPVGVKSAQKAQVDAWLAGHK